MSKYLRVDDNEMDYLVKSALSGGMVFESPNAVIREILRMDSKKRTASLTHTEAKKIRIDDDVLERLEAEARELNMNIRPIDKLLREVLKLREGDRNGGIVRTTTRRLAPKPIRRPGGRPATS